MNEKLNFIWIDDSNDREVIARTMGQSLAVNVNFVCLRNKNVIDELKKVLNSTEPDLIVMDHSLDQSLSSLIRSGSSAVALIREKWHSIPIVSVTGTNIRDMDARHRSAYEAIFQINTISKHYEKIISIATGFKSLKEKAPSTMDDVILLLNVPAVEKNIFGKVLPKNLKDNFEDKSYALELFRWCDTIFFKRPGFLYNRLWLSTLLGLSSEGFDIVEEKFTSAKYSGLFANDKLWWKSEVLSLLGELSNESGLPWVLGRKLVPDNLHVFSKCYVSGEEYPETVAAVDDTFDAEWYPMKLKFTEPHPRYEDMLFFDELRMMKGED